MLTDYLEKEAALGVPLIEIMATVKRGISLEVACELINRQTHAVVAFPYNPKSENRDIVIEMHPRIAGNFGLFIQRIPLSDSNRSEFKWSCDNIVEFQARYWEYFDYVCLSQPGSFDNGQPYL